MAVYTPSKVYLAVFLKNHVGASLFVWDGKKIQQQMHLLVSKTGRNLSIPVIKCDHNIFIFDSLL